MPYKNICYVYPPQVKDIVGNKLNSIFVTMLTITQEEIEDEFVKNNVDLTHLLTPFEYLLANAYKDAKFKSLLEQAFMFFVREPVTLLYEQKEIIIGDIKDIKTLQDVRILKEEDFFDFQNLIRDSMGYPSVERPREDEDPRVKAIKAKARYRDKLKAKQGKGLNLKSMLSSICCMGFGLNPLNIGELSYAAVPELLARYQEKEKYELDVDSLLAGADSKKVKPKYWIRNLDN